MAAILGFIAANWGWIAGFMGPLLADMALGASNNKKIPWKGLSLKSLVFLGDMAKKLRDYEGK